MFTCMSSLLCVRQSIESMCVFTKLLHRSLEWRPGEGKLDAATMHCVFQGFPPSIVLGTGLKLDICGRHMCQK